MDDLISRKAVLDGMMKYGFLAPDMTVHEFVEDELPSVPAVPMDKLCEWMAERFYYPCQIIEDCNAFCTPDCVGHDGKKVACWKKVLTKWMEGLEE